MEFKELRLSSGMTLTEFSKYFGIPYKTLQHWEYGERKCPEYLLDLMAYKLENEKERG
jgi:DNA-binding transcriptional regulator YiaG